MVDGLYAPRFFLSCLMIRSFSCCSSAIYGQSIGFLACTGKRTRNKNIRMAVQPPCAFSSPPVDQVPMPTSKTDPPPTQPHLLRGDKLPNGTYVRTPHPADQLLRTYSPIHYCHRFTARNNPSPDKFPRAENEHVAWSWAAMDREAMWHRPKRTASLSARVERGRCEGWRDGRVRWIFAGEAGEEWETMPRWPGPVRLP